MAGLNGATGGDGDALASNAVDTAITITIRKISILVAVSGSVIVLSGMAMPVKRMSYTKKQGNGLRSASRTSHVSVV